MKIGRSENLFENRSSHFHTVHLAFTRYVRDLPHSQFSPFWFCERFWKLPMSYSNLEYFGLEKDVWNCGQSWDLGPVRCKSGDNENSRFGPSIDYSFIVCPTPYVARSHHFDTAHLAIMRYVWDLPQFQFSPIWFCERFRKLSRSYSNLEYFGFGEDVLNCR